MRRPAGGQTGWAEACAGGPYRPTHARVKTNRRKGRWCRTEGGAGGGWRRLQNRRRQCPAREAKHRRRRNGTGGQGDTGIRATPTLCTSREALQRWLEDHGARSRDGQYVRSRGFAEWLLGIRKFFMRRHEIFHAPSGSEPPPEPLTCRALLDVRTGRSCPCPRHVRVDQAGPLRGLLSGLRRSGCGPPAGPAGGASRRGGAEDTCPPGCGSRSLRAAAACHS